MRKLFIIGICLFTTLLCSTAYAATPVNQILTNSYKQESQQVENDLNTNTFQPKDFIYKSRDVFKKQKNLQDLNLNSPDDMVYGNPYKVYNFPDSNKYMDILNGENLSNLLTENNCYWEVPVYLKSSMKPLTSFDMKMIDGQWKTYQIVGYLSPELSDLSSNTDKISQLLKNNGITEADKITHIEFPYIFDFFYINSGNNEYFIPLFSNKDNVYGLKNLTLYSRDQFMRALKPLLLDVVNNKDTDKVYGTPTYHNNDKYIVGGSLFAVGIMAAIFGSYKIKRKTK